MTAMNSEVINNREQAFAVMEASREQYLSAARFTARKIALSGDGTCTIDMVRELCPPPAGVDPRVMGAVFATPEWEHFGFTKSTRKTCHKRPISRFALVGE